MNGVPGVPVSPLDEYRRWRRDGERRIQQLVDSRQAAQQEADNARVRLAEIDAAIDDLSTLLCPPETRRVALLEDLLREAAGDLADVHPIQERIRAALERRGPA